MSSCDGKQVNWRNIAFRLGDWAQTCYRTKISTIGVLYPRPRLLSAADRDRRFRILRSESNRNPCQAREVRDFHKPETALRFALHIDSYRYCSRNPRLARGLRETDCRSAPNPVMRLWTGCTRLKIQTLQSAIFH
jgi:hypothetical protein